MGRKTPLNKSAALDLGWDIVDELIKINTAFKEKVDFDKKDKKHALYLILGGATTFIVRALHSIHDGDEEELAQWQRLIAESMDLALFFCESQNESRQITQWFNGKIVERQPGNSGNLSNKDRATLFNTSEKVIENIDRDNKLAGNLLSRFFHPSYDLATMIYDRNTRDFKYYQRRRRVYSEDEIESFVGLTTQPIITAFGLCMEYMFPSDKPGDGEKGLEYMKTLAEFSRKLFPELYENKE